MGKLSKFCLQLQGFKCNKLSIYMFLYHGLKSAALLVILCFVLQLEHGFDLTVSRMRMKQQYLNNCLEIN